MRTSALGFQVKDSSNYIHWVVF